jgi:hypothetical protein
MAEIGWQEAVATLTRERSVAVSQVRTLKRRGSAAEIARLEPAYDAAKAEYDGLIAGLCVALARGKQPASLADLEARLTRGAAKLEVFSRGVAPLIKPAGGGKGFSIDITGGALVKLMEALQAIYLRHKDDDALVRRTIETQLAAAVWPAFAAISSEG